MSTARVEVVDCDGPGCERSSRGRVDGWIEVVMAGMPAPLDFCSWDCLVNHAIAAPDLRVPAGVPA